MNEWKPFEKKEGIAIFFQIKEFGLRNNNAQHIFLIFRL